MTVEEAIYARITEIMAVQLLTGGRIYLGQLPQSPQYPAVLVQLISEPSDAHLRGPTTLHRSRVQVDAFVRAGGSGLDPYTEVGVLTEAMIGDGKGLQASGLDGWIGTIGSPPVDVASCHAIARMTRWDPDELQVLTMSTDFTVWASV